MPKNFALTGVAGYIAPRHLKAIKATGNTLVAALDPNDSVGILDSYSFSTSYFKEFERFDRHVERLRRQKEEDRIHYVTICSPNYLHDAHIRFALRIGADAICEKPLVLNPWNVDALEELALEQNQKIYNVLQLRTHPAIIGLKDQVSNEFRKVKYDIELTYITSRGKWYLNSWKGNPEQSGGLTTNIGIHFFDMLIWIFGKVAGQEVHYSSQTKAAGFIELERARVKWLLSIDINDLPSECKSTGKNTYRSITVDGNDLEFSDGFTDLHTRVYEDILAGRGFGPADARESIQLAHDIRNAMPTGVCIHSHPFLRKVISRCAQDFSPINPAISINPAVLVKEQESGILHM